MKTMKKESDSRKREKIGRKGVDRRAEGTMRLG
jgi:hypothetical protein